MYVNAITTVLSFYEAAAIKIPIVERNQTLLNEVENYNNFKEQQANNMQANGDFLRKKNEELKMCNGINILEITISQFQQYISSGQLTSEQIVSCYINRIEVMDGNLKSVLQVNKNAPAIARALDEERKKGIYRGPLHGVPILIKDNIATGDGLFNTAGSYTLRDSAPKLMAHLIKKLKSKGAIVLGKANLSIWSEVPSVLDSGWSPRGGQVRNPYILSANPLGSSSGSAVAVASNLAMAAIGTDTHGSIGGPAGRSSVVGFKPTAGLVSRHAVIPFSLTHDTVGPITRTMMDSALIMEAIAGADRKDKYNRYIPLNFRPPQYSSLNNNLQLNGIKIGIERKMFNALRPDELSSVNKFVNYIKNTKAQITYIDEAIEPETKDKKFDDNIHLLVDFVEFKQGIKEYLTLINEPLIHNLTDINNMNVQQAHEHDPKSLQKIDKLKIDTSSQEYKNALELNQKWYAEDGVDRILKKYNLDALLTTYGRPCNKIGYPILTMPFPVDVDGLPIKRPAFCAGKMKEDVLFTIGFAIEPWIPRPTPSFKQCCSKDDFKKLVS